jgi:hypothetical protein
MPLPPYVITEDIREFAATLVDSIKTKPSILEKDVPEIYQLFCTKYYPLSESQQTEFDECITTELLEKYYNYETVIHVHYDYTIRSYQGTYYRMDPDSESGYFVTSNDWYIVEKREDWEMFPTHPQIIIENKGVVRIYE